MTVRVLPPASTRVNTDASRARVRACGISLLLVRRMTKFQIARSKQIPIAENFKSQGTALGDLGNWSLDVVCDLGFVIWCLCLKVPIVFLVAAADRKSVV